MKLYVMRHAEPEPGERMDAARGLTPKGERQAREMGEFLRRIIGTVNIIITSPFARTAETAEIMGKVLGCEHIEATRLLEPDQTKGADIYQDITRIAQQSEDVLIVGHHPSIQILIDWICGVNVVKNRMKHGSIVHLHNDDLAWFVTPQLVEKDQGEQEAIEAAAKFGLSIATDLREHLMRSDRRAVVDPLVAKLTKAVAKRFRRQFLLVRRYVDLSDFREVLSRRDDKFGAAFERIAKRAYGAGAAHAVTLLPASAREAAVPPGLPGPKRDAANLEDEIDSTSLARLSAVLMAARTSDPPASYSDLLAQVKALFDEWASGATGQTSRAESIAQNEVSTAYHNGMADLAAQWAGGNGPVEKSWSVQPGACPQCEENAAEGWIDNEAPFGSGDFGPPLHPNCRCSLDYQPAEASATVQS